MTKFYKLYYWDSVEKRYLGFYGVYPKVLLDGAKFCCLRFCETAEPIFLTIPFFNNHV